MKKMSRTKVVRVGYVKLKNRRACFTEDSAGSFKIMCKALVWNFAGKPSITTTDLKVSRDTGIAFAKFILSEAPKAPEKQKFRLAGCMTSECDEWMTPPDVFARVEKDYGTFDLDVCASKVSAKCEAYFSIEENGLEQKWEGRCWMNPPYGREIGKWMRKAFEEAEAGRAEVVCLVPARTDTKWWHDYATKADNIEFMKGRVRFIKEDGTTGCAPFPSAIVRFRRKLINDEVA